MTITPDSKDWTWVLNEPCPECGFFTKAPARADLSPLVREVRDRWVLAGSSFDTPSARPDPVVWSPVEYACHVRDVFELASFRTSLMLNEDGPVFPNWDQDATAVAEDYGAQDLDAVMPRLAYNATVYAAALDSVSDAEWSRQGTRSDGALFTVESFARYLVHDPIHHLTDVTGVRWTS